MNEMLCLDNLTNLPQFIALYPPNIQTRFSFLKTHVVFSMIVTDV